MNKKFSILIYIQLVAAVLFSVFSLSFNADISLLAFPISLIYSALVVWFTFFKMFKPLDGKKIAVVNKLLQYIPYVFLVAFIIRRAGNEGTYLWYDIITVLLWCVIFVTSLMITHYFHPKRVAKLTETWNVKAPEPKKLKGIKKADREKAIEDAMNLVKIKDRERQLIKGLSKGYKQRVGFAQAFQLVMAKAGIESYIVDGGSDNRYLTVNIVKLNNKYYYIDAAEASKGMDKFLYGDNGSNAYEAWGIKVEDTGYKVPSTETPVVKPTEAPAVKPTEAPVVKPTEAPVVKPTEAPVVKPTEVPTKESEVMPDETITENTMQNVDETYEEYTEEQATEFDTEETEGSVQLEEVHKGNSEPWIIVLLVVAVMIIVSIITAIVFLLKKR